MSELNTKLYFRVAFFALLLHFASGDCVKLDLGMKNGSIPDNNITASSEKSGNPAKNGRLNSGSSWCAETSDSNPHLQIDLQTLHIICAVSTQGNSQQDHWVKTYKLQLSTNGSTWSDYKEGGQVKSLTGNNDRNSEVKHILYEGVFTRYLRFLPETHQGAVCLRTELFGVKLKPENLALGKTTNQSSTYNSGLVGLAVSDRAVDGNDDTNMQQKHCSQTEKKNDPSWWRVDLGSDHVPVSQIYIVNRFSPGDPTETSEDYEITLGNSADVTTNPKCLGKYTFIKFKASAVCFTNPLKTGRYVGIKTTKSQALQLCEVEIYSRENLAYKKQTSQSSTREAGGASKRGVDGNSATSFRDNSCTHTDTENKPWWRVDLGKEEQVSEVYIVNRASVGQRLSNFEIRVGTISDQGGVTNPACGSGYGVPEGQGLSFFCRPPLYGRYVTIRSLLINEPLTLCEVEVYSERRACPIQAIGVASKDALPDSSFSASSSRSGYEAFKGRVYGGGAWSPSNNNDANDYLQIDLLYEFVICAVATQGNPNADHWTTKYKLQLSYCGGSWVIYQENNVDKVFNGNSGRNDIVKHGLKEYTSARFIRFQPMTYNNHKALRVELFGILLSTVPSQAPVGFTVVASTSTSITASWQLPPGNARHGNITGFKLFYRKKDSAGPPLNLTINGGGNHSEDVAGLAQYTEYEFQVLAFTSVGDGPKSSIEVGRTKEDAPDVPATFNHTNVAPDMSHGPKVNLTWSQPIEANGIIRNYTLFYGHEKDKRKETFGKDTLSHSVDVLGGVTYQFHVRAVTIKPGQNASLTVNVPEYEPSVGPDNVLSSKLNKTTFNISWAPLTREKSYGKVILYDVKEELLSRGKRRKRSPNSSRKSNTTATFAVLFDLLLCSRYNVSVRAYTKAGPGPYSQPLVLETSNVGGKDKTEGSDSFNPAFVAVPVVLLLLILTALIVVVWYRRKRQPQKKNKRDKTLVQLDDISRSSVDATATSTNPVYQNVADIQQHHQDVVEATSPEENEVVYSEAKDSKPKPIPVAEFARYFRNKSSNGAIVLREEFRNLPAGLEFPWEVGKNNRVKNRYGNITSYDHSRVVLEQIGGDPKSDYINASYMPTFDEDTMRYIATQGPTQETLTDFWRMIWQENCATIVMLTNLVEMGKKKCDQYWPDSTTKHGSITVTLQETKHFADYVVRTFILVKDSEKREVLQFHYVTWPDKGVPERSTALLGFRWKVHARHQATGGPLVVHCSAGVGRTGTYIAIDAMLEGAAVKKSVSIQNYVQVMRRCRPYMVQKEEQYVFLHQAVMEALTCGNTEIDPQDLRITMNKLSRTQKSSQRTGFAKEFKRLELVSACQSSGNESEAGFKPSSIKKNRFPNIVPLDSSRVFLSSSEPEKDYINASFVDDYKQRGAYILTQAPLDNTVEDFWCMISQYEIGTIVMLNSLKEEQENYPQYWPTEGSAQYGSITIQKISEKTSKKITTRMFSVSNAERPRKQLSVQHLHFNGWSNPDSCPDPKEILDLLTAIQQSQQQTGNGVIVFQCSDGVGRSGCVSSIMSVIERVKSEQTVDVFQTVKLIRARRPGAVDTLDRYEFCYKTIQAYLDSFSTYANFADC